MLLTAVLLLGGAQAQAAIMLRNDNQSSVWFTVYDLTKNELSTGCVPPRRSKAWSSPRYEQVGGLFYLRAEVKERPNCEGLTLFDTQFGPALTVSGNTTLLRTLGAGKTPTLK